MADLPYRVELSGLQEGPLIVRALQRALDALHTDPFGIGPIKIHTGVPIPENNESGSVGDLYCRTDASTAGTGLIMGVPNAPTNALDSLNVPVLWSKVRGQNTTTGWSPVGAWMHVTCRSTEYETTNGTARLDDWNPGSQTLVTNAVILWNGDSDTTITGISRGYNGQLLLITNRSTTQVMAFRNNSTQSLYGNRFTNMATSGNMQLALGGTAVFVYNGTTWLMLDLHQGAWIDNGTAAGNFSGNGAMTWTVDPGDIVTYRYLLNGRTLDVHWYLSATSVGGTLNTQLLIRIPNAYTATMSSLGPHLYSDNGGANRFGYAQQSSGGTNITLNLIGGGNWAAATNTTATYGQARFQVN